MDFTSLFNKLLNNNLTSRKNYILLFFVLLIILLNVLGFDIAKISNTPYIIIILFAINFIINILTDTFTMNKLDEIKDILDRHNNMIDLLENNIEKSDINLAYLNKLKDINEDLRHQIKDLAVEVTGKPNIPTVRIILKSDTRTLLFDLFSECLNYTLICTNTNLNIANERLETDLKQHVNDYINNVHATLDIHDHNETFSINIKNKLDDLIKVILNDIQTNKTINEKLYILSIILKNIKNEINIMIVEYLRTIQTKIN